MTARDIAAALPDIDTLRSRCLAAAMLDAILWPEWEGRRYTHTADWGGGQSATEIRDGCGNECFIVYTTAGAFIRGFDHESPLAKRPHPHQLWPGLVDGLPEVFAEFLTEPAFLGPDGMLAATFCMWRQPSDHQWHTGPVDYTGVPDIGDPDGAHDLLGLLTDPTTQSYRRFAADYFGVHPDPAAVSHVYGLRPLTQSVVVGLNADLALDDLGTDITLSGYPTR